MGELTLLAFQRILAERDAWRARAERAEAALTRIREVWAEVDLADWRRADQMEALAAEALAAVQPETQVCGSVMVGSGTDTYDPACGLHEGHDGPCKSSAARDQHRLIGRGQSVIDAAVQPDPINPDKAEKAQPEACDFCGQTEGHSPRCSVTKFGVNPKPPYQPEGPCPTCGDTRIVLRPEFGHEPCPTCKPDHPEGR